ncbi:MAG TPA: hypothetical protein VKU38_06970 [Ktedonobacteraceae bacterium]|nr:hypothetical protein [Ktedonobacteraceae bacterium]
MLSSRCPVTEALLDLLIMYPYQMYVPHLHPPDDRFAPPARI